MHYVYVLKSQKDHQFYIGCTGDLKKRFSSHNSGKIYSTRNRKPFILVHYEAFIDKKDAFAREQWLKTGWGHNHLEKILNNYVKNLGG